MEPLELWGRCKGAVLSLGLSVALNPALQQEQVGVG